ncbi:MAG: TIGR04283 family arsenosugar biosynthesis glycosyltransferase [Gammaproteobacteria bacterium]|nr:TIGR04283 family arsenosugar biosynthesis glycosyltransferase [Gammaproteobacteria bacterium]
MSVTISVIIPVFNEGTGTKNLVRDLTTNDGYNEIIVVDASTNDASRACLVELATEFDGTRLAVYYIDDRGRARQMNFGSAHANSDILLFLHADTLLPDCATAVINEVVQAGALWGRFDVRLDADGWWFRIVETAMNCRSALTGIATGDQAIFVRRGLFESMGGYADIALMEDIDLSRRLKRIAPPVRLRDSVVTSARRWQGGGVFATVIRMWTLRLLFWFGVSPNRLERWYGNAR